MKLFLLLFIVLYPNTSQKFDGLLYTRNKKGIIVIEHNSYMIGYDTIMNTSRWASYMLTKHMIDSQVIKRTNTYRKNPLLNDIETDNPASSDYTNSGYDRGHLVNAEDMRFDSISQYESFYMTNMIPQKPELNRGTWKILEDKCREWTLERDTIFIFCGPIFTDPITYIGKNKIPVPSHCYKIIFDPETNECISFIFKNEDINDDIRNYMVSVDEIESITRLNFLYKLPNEIEFEIESTLNDNWLN